MKHLNLVIICLGFAAVLQAQKLKTIETDTSVNGVYQHLSKSTLTYDANCFLITTLDQEWNVATSTYLDASLITYTNNANGTVNQALFQSINNGNWVNLLRFSYTYTGFGKVATTASDAWLQNAWNATTFTTYTYDANHYLIQDSTALVIANFPASKNIYVNNVDGSPNLITTQTWNIFPPKWKNANRTSITYYNNNPQKTLTTKTETASGNNWINSDSTTYTYNGNGVATSSLEQTWDIGSSSWKNYKKNNYSYNGDGTPSTVVTQNWNGTAWVDYERSTYTYTTNCLLPLTFLNFNAVKQNNKIQLSWKTANEINTSHFSIQRSTNAVNFTTIGKVNAAGSSLQSSYGFADDISQLKTNKVYYRLQQEDKDGKITLSNIVVVSIAAGTAQFTMLPNPARNYFTVIPDGSIDLTNATITISSLTGKLLIKQKLQNNGEQKINISALSKGMYMVNIITNSSIQTQKLIVE